MSISKLLGVAVTVLVALAALLLGYVYASSEWMLRRAYEAPMEPIPAVSAHEDLMEGRRLAIIVGCWAGCHGMEGQGDTLEARGVFWVTGPTLSPVLRDYTDPELVRLVRYGVKRDGRTALGMASGTFYPLSNLDLARIIAHLRRAPALPPIPRERHVKLLGRVALVLGKWHTSAGEVDRSAPRWGELPRGTPFERGRYLASITCSECHGRDLKGNELEGGPSLAVVAGYSPEQFRHLLRTGQPLSGRDLGIMSWTARNAFTFFNDQEIDDLYSYVRAYHGVASPLP